MEDKEETEGEEVKELRAKVEKYEKTLEEKSEKLK